VAHVEVKPKDISGAVPKMPSDTKEVQELKKRVLSLETQLKQHTYQMPQPVQYHPITPPTHQTYCPPAGRTYSQSPGASQSWRAGQSQTSSTRQSNPTRKPFSHTRHKVKSFSYRCGEDFHHLPDCPNDSNPILVQQKLLQRFHLNK
jgi:hypothetical protein